MNQSCIREIVDRLHHGKRFRREVSPAGWLRIDRPLPFLCVCRVDKSEYRDGLEAFVAPQASHLILTKTKRNKESVASLLSHVFEELRKRFEELLLLEVWIDEEYEGTEYEIPTPLFKVYVPENSQILSTAKVLSEHLEKIVTSKQRAVVEMKDVRYVRTPGSFTLLSSEKRESLCCHTIGIEVCPIWINRERNEHYQVLQRSLARQFSRALKRTLFHFSSQRTTLRIPHYNALGPRAMGKVVREVDTSMAEIARSFDLVLQMTPVNLEKAWESFKRSRYQQQPRFYYRPLPIDPSLCMRRLFQIPVEQIEDPNIGQLFRGKRRELSTQISLLHRRDTVLAPYASTILYGPLDSSLVETAKIILRSISPRSRDRKIAQHVDAKEFIRIVRKELSYYRKQWPNLSTGIELRDDIHAGVMVSRGSVLVSTGLEIARSRVNALIQHEVGTHVVTYENGRSQPFEHLSVGLPGYEVLQEGLAVLAEYLVGGLSKWRFRMLAARVLATHFLMQRATFVEAFDVLCREYGMARKNAFMTVSRVYRGGGFTKDAVYLQGFFQVLEHLRNDGCIEDLYVGKIGLGHLPLVRELRLRKILKASVIRPRFLEMPEACERLVRLRQGVSIVQLIKG